MSVDTAKRLRTAGQLEMPVVVGEPGRRPGRGGPRKGAGRRRAPGTRPSVPHRRRPRHYGANPVHVTLRARADLVVEAVGRQAYAHDMLRSGVGGLVISIAKRLNHHLRRRGKVWADRWHGRELASPREVRSALVYVFRNVAKHGARMVGDDLVDPLSSAPRFARFTRTIEWPFPNGDGPWPEGEPRTWLLRTGWHLRHGLIDPREVRARG